MTIYLINRERSEKRQNINAVIKYQFKLYFQGISVNISNNLHTTSDIKDAPLTLQRK